MTALRMAKDVAVAHGCLMAGNICNTTCYDPDDPVIIQKVREMFKVRVLLLLFLLAVVVVIDDDVVVQDDDVMMMMMTLVVVLLLLLMLTLM